MKINRVVPIIFSLLLLSFIFSCTKESENTDNIANAKKSYPNTSGSMTFSSGNGINFATGTNGNSFAQGGGNTTFAEGGIDQNTVGSNDDPSCLYGTWIEPQYLAPPCPSYGFHLRLVFNGDGSGHATHLDEYLCIPDDQKDFTWDLSGGILHIMFD
ncbi:MAG: hypothetical protein HGB12_17610, partial [Bacteroidetes bacterium]|nr:hypothetical protein [Bacteroidota bacterium]